MSYLIGACMIGLGSGLLWACCIRSRWILWLDTRHPIIAGALGTLIGGFSMGLIIGGLIAILGAWYHHCTAAGL